MEITLPAVKRKDAPEMIAFELPELFQDDYARMVEKGKAKGDYYQLKISLPFRRRSTGEKSQNHHFNGHIVQICQDTGNDFADAKLAIKRRAFRRGLRYKVKQNGDIVYSLADGEPLPISETDMSVEECGWCIEEAHILAAELGIILKED